METEPLIKAMNDATAVTSDFVRSLSLPWDRSPLRFVLLGLVGAAYGLYRVSASNTLLSGGKLLKRGTPAFRRYYEKCLRRLPIKSADAKVNLTRALRLEWRIEDGSARSPGLTLPQVLAYINEIGEMGNVVKVAMEGDRIRVGGRREAWEIRMENGLFVAQYQDIRGEAWDVMYETPEKMVWVVGDMVVPTHTLDNMIHIHCRKGDVNNFAIAEGTFEQFESVDGVVRRRRDSLYRRQKMAV